MVERYYYKECTHDKEKVFMKNELKERNQTQRLNNRSNLRTFNIDS